jgi:glycosyltransferase involved in cell wall biosynthesis
MVQIPYEWVFFICVLVVWVLFGDASVSDTKAISPPSVTAAIMWKHVDPPETRIRMLWVIHSYVPFVNAGSEVCAHTINRHFMSKPYKYDVWVACPNYPKQVYEGVRCFDLHDSATLSEVLKTTHVVHSHSYIYRKQMQWIAKNYQIPFVEWVHTDNYVRSVPEGRWVDPAIKDLQWTVFNSKSLLESRRYDMDTKKTFILHPVVDYREYTVDEKERNPVYVTLSNVNDNKGGRLLIDLAKALPDVQFQGILGGYRSQIVDKGVPNLRYVPNTTKIKDVYAQTWALIMPSKEETWGRTAVEAMASGIPVVVAPTPGLRECCGDAAIFCERNDLNSWVSAIQKLRSDKEYYNWRSKEAYGRARALDPEPDLERMDKWMEKEVCTGIVPSGKELTMWQKFLLFR